MAALHSINGVCSLLNPRGASLCTEQGAAQSAGALQRVAHYARSLCEMADLAQVHTPDLAIGWAAQRIGPAQALQEQMAAGDRWTLRR